jgi:membrane fusion protein (multidrug efflux system)
MADITVDDVATPLPGAALPKRKLKQVLYAGIAGLIAVTGARYGYDWWTVGRFVETTDDAYVGGDVTPISPHVAGFVSEILVSDNDYVHAGQPLIRLDDRDFRAAFDHATAVVGQKEATLAGLQAREQSQQAVVRQAEADIEAKTAQAAFARLDDARYRDLAATGAGSRQDAERAVTQDTAARSAVDSSHAALEAARQQLTALDAQIVEARAAVDEAKADLATARLNLSYTEIRSPIDGYIGTRAAQVGAYVSGGAYLVTVIPAHDLWVDANFKEDQLEHMKRGQTVTVVADQLPDHVFHGRVDSLARGTGAIFSVIPPENATGNFTKIVQRVPVRVHLDGNDPMIAALRPGLSTTVDIDTHSAEETQK